MPIKVLTLRIKILLKKSVEIDICNKVCKANVTFSEK